MPVRLFGGIAALVALPAAFSPTNSNPRRKYGNSGSFDRISGNRNYLHHASGRFYTRTCAIHSADAPVAFCLPNQQPAFSAALPHRVITFFISPHTAAFGNKYLALHLQTTMSIAIPADTRPAISETVSFGTTPL
ncbi:MAG: hypothetical protein IJ479_03100 [Alphaproteobacteria bacterium]|nr:hypothetical protein [Alphaproteobacteria bacterium]